MTLKAALATGIISHPRLLSASIIAMLSISKVAPSFFDSQSLGQWPKPPHEPTHHSLPGLYYVPNPRDLADRMAVRRRQARGSLMEVSVYEPNWPPSDIQLDGAGPLSPAHAMRSILMATT
jgi:hypothetical protein